MHILICFQDQLTTSRGTTENHLKVTLTILSRYTKVSWIICTDSKKCNYLKYVSICSWRI